MTSRATVYNTLNWLKSVGMLQERFEGERVLYDPNCERHHHFVCNGCGSVKDVGYDVVGKLGKISLPDDDIAETYEITIRGLCAGCS